MPSLILGITDPEDFKKYLIKSSQDGKYHCSICNEFSHIGRSQARDHVESKHFPGRFIYTCDICNETFTTKTNVNNHKTRKHKLSKTHNY